MFTTHIHNIILLGYVPRSRIKVDFSSDLDNKERPKRKKVSFTRLHIY